jgi:ubiquinone/menaquinone biosynthesis C-methylase UbiE
MLVCKFDQARDRLIKNFFNNHLSGKKILELGCGSGDRTKLFYDYSEVIGIDIKNKIDYSRKNKFEFLMSDATKLPFKDESFDAVVSFDVIEHIWNDKEFVSEAYRVCKSGGYVILGTPNRVRLSNRLMPLFGKKITYPYCLGPDTIHVREYTRSQFTSLCKSTRLIGECVSIWIGLVGRFDRGLPIFPRFVSSLAQYLLFIGYKR